MADKILWDIGVKLTFPCFRCLNIGNNMSRRWRALFCIILTPDYFLLVIGNSCLE